MTAIIGPILRNFIPAVLVLLILLPVSSCDLAGFRDTGRDNPRDLKNPDYKPQPVEDKRAYFLSDPESRGRIVIRWTRKSLHEDGILIEKAENGTDFEVLAEIPASYQRAVDSTLQYTPFTKYRVLPYIMYNGKRHYEPAEPASLSFGLASSLSADYLSHWRRFRIDVTLVPQPYDVILRIHLVTSSDESVLLQEFSDYSEFEHIDSGRYLYSFESDIIPSEGSRLRLSWHLKHEGDYVTVGEAETDLTIYQAAARKHSLLSLFVIIVTFPSTRNRLSVPEHPSYTAET